jgi:hypothetical protein
MVSAGRCLVVGSYPPVPGTPAAATVAAVQRTWAAGAEVVVASPRPSAAAHVVLRHGPALGRELAALRRRLGCDDVVICMEPGWPLTGAGPGLSARTTEALAGALLGTRRAELVITGSPAQWAPSLPALAPLWPAVTVVTTSSEALAAAVEAAVAGAGPRVRALPPGHAPDGAGVASRVQALPPGYAQDGAGVGPLEPGELLWATRARRLAGRVARRALGRREPVVHACLARLLRPVLALVRRS